MQIKQFSDSKTEVLHTHLQHWLLVSLFVVSPPAGCWKKPVRGWEEEEGERQGQATQALAEEKEYLLVLESPEMASGSELELPFWEKVLSPSLLASSPAHTVM